MLERPLVRAEFLEYRVVRIDLHTHSTASDGTDSPAELVRNAAAAGLDVVALTDHDTTRGHAEAIEALPEGLTLVTGAELSCRVDGIGLHMLAYLFDPADPARHGPPDQPHRTTAPPHHSAPPFSTQLSPTTTPADTKDE